MGKSKSYVMIDGGTGEELKQVNVSKGGGVAYARDRFDVGRGLVRFPGIARNAVSYPSADPPFGPDWIDLAVGQPSYTFSPLATVDLTVSPASITLGQSATLSWTSENTASLVASGAWSGSRPPSGSEVVTPSSAGALNYTLTTTGVGVAASDSASLLVEQNVLSVSLNASADELFGGETLVLSWTSAGASSLSASGSWSGIKAPSGSESIVVPQGPRTVRTYTLTAQSGSNSAVDSVQVLVKILPIYAFSQIATVSSSVYSFNTSRTGGAAHDGDATINFSVAFANSDLPSIAVLPSPVQAVYTTGGVNSRATNITNPSLTYLQDLPTTGLYAYWRLSSVGSATSEASTVAANNSVSIPAETNAKGREVLTAARRTSIFVGPPSNNPAAYRNISSTGWQPPNSHLGHVSTTVSMWYLPLSGPSYRPLFMLGEAQSTPLNSLYNQTFIVSLNSSSGTIDISWMYGVGIVNGVQFTEFQDLVLQAVATATPIFICASRNASNNSCLIRVNDRVVTKSIVGPVANGGISSGRPARLWIGSRPFQTPNANAISTFEGDMAHGLFSNVSYHTSALDVNMFTRWRRGLERDWIVTPTLSGPGRLDVFGGGSSVSFPIVL